MDCVILQIVIPETDIVLSTVLGKEYLIPVVLLGAADSEDKCNNLISYNGTCNGGIENFKVTTFPFTCTIRFTNPVSQIDVCNVFTVEPHFSLKTGTFIPFR